MRLQATYLGLRLLIISNYAKLSRSLLDGLTTLLPSPRSKAHTPGGNNEREDDGGGRDEDGGGRDEGGGS